MLMNSSGVKTFVILGAVSTFRRVVSVKLKDVWAHIRTGSGCVVVVPGMLQPRRSFRASSQTPGAVRHSC